MRNGARGALFHGCVACLAIVACACDSDPAREPPGCGESNVIYGSDDRREPFEVPVGLASKSRGTAIAIIEQRLADDVTSGRIEGDELSFGGAYGLCEGERFAAQPSLASCAGILVAPDLVLTAGHCIHDAACDRYVYVGGFEQAPSGTAMPLSDSIIVRHCEEILAFAYDRETGAAQRDFAWIRLDAPMSGVGGADAVRSGALDVGETVVLAGYPSGLPLKVMSGQVVDAREMSRDFFGADLDNFGGASGGPVFDAKQNLVGMALYGQEDFAYDSDAGCFRTRVATVDVANQKYEHVAYIEPLLREACRRGVNRACALSLDAGGGSCGR